MKAAKSDAHATNDDLWRWDSYVVLGWIVSVRAHRPNGRNIDLAHTNCLVAGDSAAFVWRAFIRYPIASMSSCNRCTLNAIVNTAGATGMIIILRMAF